MSIAGENRRPYAGASIEATRTSRKLHSPSHIILFLGNYGNLETDSKIPFSINILAGFQTLENGFQSTETLETAFSTCPVAVSKVSNPQKLWKPDKSLISFGSFEVSKVSSIFLNSGKAMHFLTASSCHHRLCARTQHRRHIALRQVWLLVGMCVHLSF